nr:MAG TPA: hypothetical protein [Caudoviricetes sp.]
MRIFKASRRSGLTVIHTFAKPSPFFFRPLRGWRFDGHPLLLKNRRLFCG